MLKEVKNVRRKIFNNKLNTQEAIEDKQACFPHHPYCPGCDYPGNVHVL